MDGAVVTLTEREIYRMNHPYQTKAGEFFRTTEALLRRLPHLPLAPALRLPLALAFLLVFNVVFHHRYGGVPW